MDICYTTALVTQGGGGVKSGLLLVVDNEAGNLSLSAVEMAGLTRAP